MNLNNDIIYHVLDLLDDKDRINFRMTCREYYYLQLSFKEIDAIRRKAAYCYQEVGKLRHKVNKLERILLGDENCSGCTRPLAKSGIICDVCDTRICGACYAIECDKYKECAICHTYSATVCDNCLWDKKSPLVMCSATRNFDEWLCEECRIICNQCRSPFCPKCAVTCKGCQSSYCDVCIRFFDENWICSNCDIINTVQNKIEESCYDPNSILGILRCSNCRRMVYKYYNPNKNYSNWKCEYC